MNVLDQAKSVLESAEKEFRDLIAGSAKQGDYESVETLTDWVLRLKGIPSKVVIIRDSRNWSNPNVNVTNRCNRKPKSKKTKAYPKFAKSDDQLVKIAWSKAKKNEYRHKSPKSVLIKLAEIFNGFLVDDKIVSMGEVLPIVASDNAPVPDYQAYLCLAWLREISAIEQIGREGYRRCDKQNTLTSLVENAWVKLLPDNKKPT